MAIEKYAVMPKTALDVIDCRIIAALQANGRLSNIELAELVGLSPSPCSRRVKRLEQDGYIEGYRAVLRRARVGLGLSVFVGVKINGHANEHALLLRELSWRCRRSSLVIWYLEKPTTFSKSLYQSWRTISSSSWVNCSPFRSCAKCEATLLSRRSRLERHCRLTILNKAARGASAPGHSRRFERALATSAFHPKADICLHRTNLCNGPLSDSQVRLSSA